MADLFGHAAAQSDFFSQGQLAAPVQSYLPDPADIRRRLNTLLATARAAERMPWPERDARVWKTIFPNMANWLPNEEAEQLRLAFSTEMERLGRAV